MQPSCLCCTPFSPSPRCFAPHASQPHQGAINAALWDLGLPPGCLRYVARVSDADIVLHVMPKRGQKHYQYDTVSGEGALSVSNFEWRDGM